jgi:hypothetical protein
VLLGHYSLSKYYFLKSQTIENLSKTSSVKSFETYNYGDAPIKGFNTEKLRHPYYEIKFRFKVNDSSKISGLLQTDVLNSGMRLELLNQTLSLIVADPTINKNGYQIFLLHKSIQEGTWYDIEIQAFSQNFIKVSLNNEEVTKVYSDGLFFSGKNFFLGVGFDQSRIFNGTIKNASIRSYAISDFDFYLYKIIHADKYEILNWLINTLILSSVLLLMLARKSIPSVIKFLTPDIRPFRNIFLILCILIQITLIYLFPAYRHVFFFYSFLFFLGLNIYLIYRPLIFKKDNLSFLLIPFYGLTLLTIIGSYLIAFSLDLNLMLPILIALTMLVFFIKYKNKIISYTFICDSTNKLKTYFIIFTSTLTPIILLLISPVLLNESHTSTYRIGPDLASYAKMAQFLIDGGTREAALQRTQEFFDMTPGEINRYSDATMSWPFIFFYRWGLAAYQVIFTKMNGLAHIYYGAFSSMVLPYILISGIFFAWVKKKLNTTITIPILGALALVLNSNLLNLWYEGFYANIFALPFYMMALFIFDTLRSQQKLTKEIALNSAFLLSIIFAAAIFSFPEGLILILLPFLSLVLFTDWVTIKKVNWVAYKVILVGLFFAFLITVPCKFIFEAGILIFKQFTQEGSNGYMQPLWALPHEVFGFANIYQAIKPSMAGQLLHRSYFQWAFGLVISFFLLYALLAFLRKRSWKIFSVQFISGLFVFLIGILVVIKSRGNNYAYMKAYVFFLPVISLLMWVVLVDGYDRLAYRFPNLFKDMPKILFLVLSSLIIVSSGLFYILQYSKDSTSVKESQIALHSSIDKSRLKNVILFPYDTEGFRQLYPAIIETPWIIPELWNKQNWKNKPYYEKFMNHRVVLFVEKRQKQEYKFNKQDLIFENGKYIIVDTSKRVKDFINKEDDEVNFKEIKSYIEILRLPKNDNKI